MREPDAPSLFGIVIYEGVEPIDVGGTVGVLSMAQRTLPALQYVVIAERAGAVRLASGLTVMADKSFDDAPTCDVTIVTGGPGWSNQVANPRMIEFLRKQVSTACASVCTGALILAASGHLERRTATTRRSALGRETASPLAQLRSGGRVAEAVEAAVVDDCGIVTSGGVSLAIDGTLYLIGRLYGDTVRDAVAASIEYDRAFATNRQLLGHKYFAAS
jgi:transcriptional regulator GlxA family with amidase domain